MESKVYVCFYQKKKNIHSLRLKSDMLIFSTGNSLLEAKENMIEKLLEYFGDGEAQLEIINEIKKNDRNNYISVSYNAGVSAENFQKLYNIYCKTCKFGKGERNNINLEIDYIPKISVVGVDRMFPSTTIYSSEFINELYRNGKLPFDTREVYYNGNKTNYFELIPNSIINQVGMRGGIYPSNFQQNFQCFDCGSQYFTENEQICVSNQSLVNNPNLFILNTTFSNCLCIKKNIWVKLVKNPRLKGLLSEKIKILKKDEIEFPKLKKLKKLDWIL